MENRFRRGFQTGMKKRRKFDCLGVGAISFALLPTPPTPLPPTHPSLHFLPDPFGPLWPSTLKAICGASHKVCVMNCDLSENNCSTLQKTKLTPPPPTNEKQQQHHHHHHHNNNKERKRKQQQQQQQTTRRRGGGRGGGGGGVGGGGGDWILIFLPLVCSIIFVMPAQERTERHKRMVSLK